MRTISFIVTTYNVAPYIERCLTSVAQIVRPGDEVIIIDDGSDDGTDQLVSDFAATSGFGVGVEYRPVFLGTNTFGGVGIGGNIGLSEATRDTVFFVDGDDWVDADGFNRSRAYWTLHPKDIMLANYREYDQAKDATKEPADEWLWRGLDASLAFEDLQKKALSFISVPWRKFYDRAFLEHNRLRFPEGNFFFEDNPFHWDACLKAGSIGFFDRVVCYHRVNRPGQTMTSTGVELTAFFVHFSTIISHIDSARGDLVLLAVRWLLDNMTWHIARLSPQAFYYYATAAAEALQKIPDDTWCDNLSAAESGESIWPVAVRLRSGDVWGQIDAWERALHRKGIEGLARDIRTTSNEAREARRMLLGESAASQFEVLTASFGASA